MLDMKKIVCYIAQSLDGYIAKQDGSVDRLNNIDFDLVSSWYDDFYKGVDTLIMWYNTYAQIQWFWERPYLWKKTYVLTHRKNLDLDSNVEFVWEDFFSKISKIKELDDNKNIRLVWWSKIVDLFLKKDLLDSFSITLIPKVLWAWIPLFQEKLDKTLELQKVKEIWTWLIQLDYNIY